MQEEEEQDEEGDADEDPGDCWEAAVVVVMAVTEGPVCDICPLLMRSGEQESMKAAAFMLFRMLQPPFPFVIMLPVPLLQLDMQLLPCGTPVSKSVVLLLFVEAVLISWLCVVVVVVDSACISHICS